MFQELLAKWEAHADRVDADRKAWWYQPPVRQPAYDPAREMTLIELVVIIVAGIGLAMVLYGLV